MSDEQQRGFKISTKIELSPELIQWLKDNEDVLKAYCDKHVLPMVRGYVMKWQTKDAIDELSKSAPNN